MAAEQVDEFRHQERFAPHLDDMHHPAAVLLLGQEREEGAEVCRIELLERRELPEQRAELVAQLEDAADLKNQSIGFAGFSQHASC